MEQPVIITSYDGSTTIPVARLNVPAGANGGSGVVNLGGGVKSYLVRIEQAGTSAPDPTIFTNTLGGTPTWARTGTGVYTLTLAGAWATVPAVLWTNGTVGDPTADGVILSWEVTSANVLTFSFFNKVGVAADLNVNLGTLQIQVYP